MAGHSSVASEPIKVAPMSHRVPHLAASQTHRDCMRRHGYRRFLNVEEQSTSLPPLLWTFPGAGNTWVRLLLDYSTGIYTGSIYGDPSLLPLLPGEGRCDRSVIAVKAHPTHIDSIDILPTHGHFRLNVTRKPQYLKCAGLRFTGTIIVVRDPYSSIWAEYKRYINWKEVIAGRPTTVDSSRECRMALRNQPLHSGALLKSCFSEAHFHTHAVHLARSWKHSWYHYGRFRDLPNARVLRISFEDLLQSNQREVELRRMAAFLGLSARVSDDAVGCASKLADNPNSHRDRHAEKNSQVASIQDAYKNASFVCQMWRLFHRKAARAGYSPFGGVKCT